VSFNVDTSSNIYASPSTNPGWGRVFGTGFSLAEGNSLVTQNSIAVALGGSGKRTLDFDLNATFDKSDVKSFGKDRVAVYLVDSNNQPLALDATHPGGVPLFSLSETGSEIIPGLVKFDGTHVQIDVSNVTGTSGKLVFQLLNQDGDSGSNLTVTNFTDNIDPNGTKGTSVSPAIAPVTPGTAKILDSYMATSTAQILLSNVSLDRATGKYTADLRVQNVGTTTLSQNLAVLLTGLPAGVTVANSSGTHPAGSAYLNFDTTIQPGGLAGGAISDAIRVVINDPTLAAFSFKPVVLQGAMAALPDLSSLSTLTVKVGEKIDIPLQGELAIKTGTKLPTGKITGDSHLVFTPAPDQVGSYTFTLIARNGSTEVTQNVTLNVVADPITTTRVTGIIADTNQAGLAGVLVELAGYQATTDSSGKFTIVLPESSAGDTLKVYGQRIQGGGITYPFIAEKMGLLLGHDIYRGVNNQIDRPIYLPTIDVSTGTTVNPGGTTLVTNPKLTGAKVTVNANSLFDKSGNAFAGILSITEVPVTLTPAALPENLHPDLVVTIQPGDMVFNTPAKLTLPNRGGYLPGLVMDLWSINPNTGTFDIVGQGKVSADGSVIETISGGIRNSSWHFFSSPPPPPLPPSLNFGKNPLNSDPNTVCDASQHPFKSQVSDFSGVVSDDRSLVTYQSQGKSQGVVLHYDSLRANPKPIVNFGSNFARISANDLLTARVTITANGITQTLPGLNSSQIAGQNPGERSWLIPANSNQPGSILDVSFQADLTNLSSGVYRYQIDGGISGLRAFTNPDFSVTILRIGTSSTSEDRLVVVNDSDSVFGGGWNVSGLEKLIVNDDRSILLIDGDGSQHIYDVPVNNVSLTLAQTYTSPLGDYSKLQRLADGTFLRTTKDGTIYQFNAQGLMVAATDTTGNKTQHVYNTLGQIQQIIDPVGLKTTFNYTGKRVTSIVDPAGRVTKLDYDAQGNLVSVTDPDGSKNQYGYDSNHLVTSSIDRAGQLKTGTYDGFGRASTATREDGSIVQIDPIEVRGLRSQRDIKNLTGLDTAGIVSLKPTATYIDGNGNKTVNQLNSKGQIISSTDDLGQQTTYLRDAVGNITRTIDANGNINDYLYDNYGNVTQIREIGSNGYTSHKLDPVVNSALINEVTSISLPAGTATVAVTGDINNDGYTDIITTGANGKLSVLFGDSNGVFASKSTIDIYPFTQSYTINQLELKDVNNDGKLDLLANLPIDGQTGGGVVLGLTAANSIQSDPVLVFLNQGNGVFANAKILPLIAKSDGFVTGDFNGDSKLDILVRSDIESANISNVYPLVLYAGDGQGNFAQSAINIPGIDLNSYFRGGLQMSAGDLFGDGKTELIFNMVDRFAVFKADANNNWSEIYTDSSHYDYREQITIGDINNDGKLDVVGVANSGIILYLNNGSTFNTKITSAGNMNFSFNPGNPVIKDIDRDGRVDLTILGKYYSGYGYYSTVASYAWSEGGEFNAIREPSSLPGLSLGMVDIDRNGIPNFIISGNNSIDILKDYPQSYPLARTTSDAAAYGQKYYTYDPKFNKLTSYRDELGRQISYTINQTNGTVSEKYDRGATTRYTYTTSGQVDTIIDALGHITDYDYDTFDRVVKTTAAKGTADQSIEQYEYDLAGNRTAIIDGLGHRTIYVYNSMNMLLQTTDTLSNATTYTYDKMGHQTSLTDALGRVTKMTYDARGRSIGTTDANGSTTTAAYDNNGNLIGITDALDRTTSYKYDARNRLISTTAADNGITAYKYDPNGNLTTSTDTLGHTTQRFYDSRNQVIREVDALGNETKYTYDAANELIATTDARGNRTEYYYDTQGREIATVRDLTQTIKNLANSNGYVYGISILATGNIALTNYDALGNIIQTRDENSNRTTYKYDALNRLIEVRDALGAVTKTAYDKVGNITSVTDALGRLTTYSYDANNRLVSTTDPLSHSTTISYNAVGDIVSTTDALGHSTGYTYDNLDRLIKTTDALGHDATISYDKVGNVISTTDELGRMTSYVYDKVDRLITTTDPLAHTTSTSYDTEGNILSTTDELGHTTTYSYDLDNRLVKSTDALNQQRTTVYDLVGNIVATTDELGRTTTYAYDKLDRLTSITDALGHATTYAYDPAGNRTQVTDALGQTTKYIYDALNRRIRTLDPLGHNTSTSYDAFGNVAAITDSVGNTTRYTYDALDRRLTDTNSLGKTLSYGYDAVGDLVQTIDRDGRKRTYDYDALNRETAEHWLDSAGTDIRTFNYGYDAVGHLLTTNDPDSKYTYTYDLVDRITSADNLGTAGVPNVLLNYSYDAAGNLLSVTDAINGSQAGTNAYTYDILNRVTRITQSGTGVTGKRVDVSYDAASQMTGLNRYGDLAGTVSVANTSYTYDLVGRLTNLTHKHGATTLASYGLVYDAANRITHSEGTDGTQDYTYDATNQLTGADHTTIADEAYSYDANGNRTLAGYGTGTNNQLLTDGTYNYEYDDEGNRTRRTEIATGKITEYVWDYRNRLTSVLFKDASGTVTKTIGYTYDVNNQRIGKNVDGAVERYVLDRNQIALVFDGSGVQKSRYLYGTQTDQVLAEETGANLRWFLADEQGTIKDVVDNTGAVIDHISYDSYGRIVNQTNPLDLRYAYTGREWDGETGQYYYRARYYDPTVGRFINEDPLGFGAGDTNIYRYVGNSPTNAVDPSGLESCGSGGEPPSLLNRIFGGLRVIGGAFQAAGGVALAGAGTAGTAGIGTVPAVVAGGLITARGADDIQAGLRQIWTGQNTNSLTYDGVNNLTGNPTLAGAVDFGTGLVSGGGAAKGIAALGGAKAAETASHLTPGISGSHPNPTMFQPDLIRGDTLASNELLQSMQSGGRRTIVIAQEGSDEARYLDYMRANASMNTADPTHILVRPDLRKIEVLEEYLHGTQQKLGIINKLGEVGAEIHVKDFMIRHSNMLGLSEKDVQALEVMKKSYIDYGG
jgi:RHS repeat-associated protein